MLYVVKQHCVEKAYLNRWAKRQLKDNRQKNEFICLSLPEFTCDATGFSRTICLFKVLFACFSRNKVCKVISMFSCTQVAVNQSIGAECHTLKNQLLCKGNACVVGNVTNLFKSTLIPTACNNYVRMEQNMKESIFVTSQFSFPECLFCIYHTKNEKVQQTNKKITVDWCPVMPGYSTKTSK